MPPRNAVPLEETVVDFVRKSEEAVLAVGRKWTEAVDEFVPVEVPLVRDLRKQVFEMVEELLRIQRDFAQKILAENAQSGHGPHRAPTGAGAEEEGQQGRLSPPEVGVAREDP